MNTQLRDIAWIDGRYVLFTDDNTNQEKALIAQAMINAFRNAYAQVLNGEVAQ